MRPVRWPRIVVKGFENRSNNSVGLCFRIKSKPAVHARDHEVERAQHLVRVAEGAVLEDVRLNPLEDTELAPIARIQLVGERVLLLDLVDAEATGVSGTARMVGYSEIVITPLARRLGHLFKSVAAVREVRVAMQETMKVILLDEFRQPRRPG